MKLALGTAQIGLDYGISNRRGQVSGEEAAAIMRAARDTGITTVDTAVSYGDSESRLGEIGVEGCQVVSKLPSIPEEIEDVSAWMAGVVRQSLARLRTKRLYGLLLHRPKQLIESRGAEIHHALESLKATGLVLKTGVSIYEPSDLDGLYARYGLDLVQAPFNLFDDRLISSGWLSRLKRGGTEVHVRSIFLQGVLLFAPRDRPRKFERWAEHFARYDEWMATHSSSALEVCVSYALSFPEIDKVIVGVESAAQLRAVVTAAKVTPPPFAASLAASDAALLDPLVWMRT